MHDLLTRVKTAMLAMARYSWEQGVAAQALWESGDTATAICMCYDAVNRQTPDGRLANLGGQNASTDPLAIIEVLVNAIHHTADPALQAALDKALHWALHTAPRCENGVVYHNNNAPEFWVDSLYMLPPVLAAAGHGAEAIRQADGYVAALLNPTTYLFHACWHHQKKTFTRPGFWGVGNGWALAGLTRLLALLPSSDTDTHARYRTIILHTIQAALPLRHPDGLFHNILDNPDTFLEAGFACLLAYTIARGVRGGWLPADLLPHAHDIQRTVRRHVNAHGFVTPVCGAPMFNSPGIAPEGQAFFVLMEAALKE